MRITGGTLRGRTLPSNGFVGIRPTTDRTRETIFNIILNHSALEGAGVIDLCAGTGALGFEALSRGAHSAVFVEKHRPNAVLIRKTAQELGLNDHTTVLCADCVKACASLQSTLPSGSQHIIFCDPPYSAKLINPVFSALNTALFLSEEALFVAEHDAREVVLVPDEWTTIAERIFGDTVVEFFCRKPSQQ